MRAVEVEATAAAAAAATTQWNADVREKKKEEVFSLLPPSNN